MIKGKSIFMHLNMTEGEGVGLGSIIIYFVWVISWNGV